MTYRTPEDLATETSRLQRLQLGMLRRVQYIRVASKSKWQVRGQRGGAGGDEVFSIETFTGFGFYARPPATGKPEVVVGCIGGPKLPVAIASRDEQTRQLIDGQVADGETAVYNDKAIIVVKANGTVEIRLIGGVALALPTMADYEALRAAFNNHTHLTAPLGPATPPTAIVGTIPLPTIPVSPPTGTTVLKTQ